MCLLMSFLINSILFQPDFITPDLDLTDISLGKKLIFGFFYLVAHFLLIVFFIRLLQHSSFFIATEDGFFYEPAGVFVGFILWKDIAAIRENRLLAAQNSSFGPTTIPALVLSLKEPQKYNRHYNFILRKIAELSSKFLRYQTQDSSRR